jgi:RNA polymerase sigma factor (TIGR02999 family)
MPAKTVEDELYEELRRFAARRMARESPGQTLQATALVHEAWLQIQSMEGGFTDRAHFFAVAATAMRRILIDRARRVAAVRHGGDLQRVSIDLDVADETGDAIDLVALAGVLEQLQERDPELAVVITMRYALGCTIEETAEALGQSPAKVKKDVALARAWLRRRLERERSEP